MDETDDVADIRWVDFAAFYRETEPRVRRALVAACGVEIGVEAASRAMELGFQRWSDLRLMDNPAGYLYRVGRNAARDRRKALPAVVPEAAERYGFEPALPDALNALTEQQRQAVLLVHGAGETLASAAAMLDISVSTLRNHLSRGLDHLRRRLGVEPARHSINDDPESDR
ncbi:RNA polymerase sigma factor [Desertimonas flava]|uniref:RNA polymerase sigma factor n=1 Tax=Desertimonas flava TaxID=2064846 RepID=UPI0013C5313B|nr:sigma-70 family RNA polymerase sigma factor [Desertimonas flava]